ncbi:MAG: flap endonuclease-1 [Candidatus Hodarchaeaceae archaeon]|nr:flap endonuclease-1 [Candidatus Hodarchaeaceae archaeon]
MGVQLGDIVTKQKVELEQLRGQVVAIDAMNSLYQFLSIIRQRDGEYLRDSKGRITSHLSGLFYRTANFVEAGIHPVYVFDGEPPRLKARTVEQRRVARTEAAEEWKRALEEGKVEEAKKFAQRAGRVDEPMIKQAQTLLGYMGLPWVQAPGEGEAQAAHLVQRGDAWAAASQDFDSLLFGAPTLVRNLAITGRRKLPGKDVYIMVSPEVIELKSVLEELGVTQEQLVDIGILVGTDYNEGIKGIGPKKALELIKKEGSIEKIAGTEFGEKFEVDPLEVREIFLKPNVTDKYKLKWGEPDPDGIKRFLCDEHDFSESRVQTGIDKLTKGRAERGQVSLKKWFG